MTYCGQVHIETLASQSNTNPVKKTDTKFPYYISKLISYNITTLVIHNKTVT